MNMEENFYDILANYYDVLQEGVDAALWGSRIHSLIVEFLRSSGEGEDGNLILVDLGCGSGAVTVRMAHDYGYETIGIDSSEEMLNMAREREGADKILWIGQDIIEYELFGAADVFISTLDTINHITEPDDVASVFASFRNYLAPGGLFIFDIGTQKHFEHTLGNNTFFEDYDDFTLLWENSYDSDNALSTSSMTLFYSEDGGKTYGRCDGEIVERYYPIALFELLCERNGMEIVYRESSSDDERILICCRKI